MNTKNVGYWALTGISAAALLAGGAGDLSRAPAVAAGIAHLGYPLYLASILGVWKILGAAALLAPRFPRLKEWAYAGILFDLSGAALSHGISGDGLGNVATPLILLGLAMGSWALRPETRRLAAATTPHTEKLAGGLGVHPRAVEQT